MNSNSPMYLPFCITLSTSWASLDAGITRHSFLFLNSLLYIVEKRFGRTDEAGNTITPTHTSEILVRTGRTFCKVLHPYQTFSFSHVLSLPIRPPRYPGQF